MDKRATAQVKVLAKSIVKQNGTDEKLKAEPVEWVGRMN